MSVFAQLLGTTGSRSARSASTASQNTAAPQVAPAMAGAEHRSGRVAAERRTPGRRPRSACATRRTALSFGPELVISSPALGPANAARGLAAAGDFSGNAAVAWAQGSGDSTQIVADQLYQPPARSRRRTKFRYVRNPRPVLSWSQARDHWGPVRYAVTIDQSQVVPDRRDLAAGPRRLSPTACTRGW